MASAERTNGWGAAERRPAKSFRSQVLPPPQSMERRAVISFPIHWGGTNSKTNTNEHWKEDTGRERAECVWPEAREPYQASGSCYFHHL